MSLVIESIVILLLSFRFVFQGKRKLPLLKRHVEATSQNSQGLNNQGLFFSND